MYLLDSLPKTSKTANGLNTERSGKKVPISSSEKELWDLFRKGDENAFVIIYKKYANILFNFGCQLTADHSLVKDCLQDFFIYIRQKRERLGPTDAIKPYLFKSFKRRILADLKKQNKQIVKESAFDFRKFPVELSYETVYINQQLEKEQIFRLNEALRQLDPKEREAIYYFYFEGLSYDQIAVIFDFSHVSSARRLVYRGLAHLRKYFVLYLLLTFSEFRS
ncbi:sigma-70 family RNA polymerase sigma factor [Echinicola sp. CAU 1574]|uniref:Sigma-70 family RNA polymerase sigma factor n=1 Tax=Echinicola arenosa TaxID=2774144 RepID=A0ABR9AIP4_9BACT|nr:sigma-70 family RNA polymerase sigma factor [Echinicola arenosa]MBD8488596.1 sigma-70 family RNA polymerase sigma factor [Echinicola arenosa]